MVSHCFRAVVRAIGALVLSLGLFVALPGLAAAETAPTKSTATTGGTGLTGASSTVGSDTRSSTKSTKSTKSSKSTRSTKSTKTTARKATSKRATVRRKAKSLTKTIDPTKLIDSGIPAVKQDGGSAHLGERTLKAGMTGHDVRVLQGYLTVAGYPTTVDGQFGPATKTNVIAFEQSQGLAPANGVVSYSDQFQLRKVVAQDMTSSPTPAPAATGTTSSTATGGKATINANGTATAPAGAPKLVQEIIAAGNQIIDTPYVYGGGHASFTSSGYDCSGAVSYALHGGNLLSAPEDSTQLESYGSAGLGKWVTVYADSGHAFLVVAGIAFDTADYGGPNIPSGSGPRWRTNPTGNLADGGDYIIRHPSGL